MISPLRFGHRIRILGFILLFITTAGSLAQAQHSVARRWCDVLLEAIRKDYARPTVHARNLFHTSVVMYDAWAVYDGQAQTYLLGKTVGDYTADFTGITMPTDIEAARNEAISYAAYRLLRHRFSASPGGLATLNRFDTLMNNLGYDREYESTNYQSGNPAALGNYIASQVIAFGLQDGSNEQNGYANQYYESINSPLLPKFPGNPDIEDPNRWQKLVLDVFIDQSGNTIPGEGQPFLGPEWGNVTPFALADSNKTVYSRAGHDYWVYHDPGPPPFLDTLAIGEESAAYQSTFSLVSVWSSHLDPADCVKIDISPNAFGNVQEYPTDIADFEEFYDLLEGNDPGMGYTVNPSTGLPYEPNVVYRGDYTRVLAEFWADGPDSETPPGHWFTLINYVNDHPMFEKRFGGTGRIVNNLEWDIKAYFMLGGTMHDAAITAWGIKGWYDYIRPVSAIRYMADKGQSSDELLPNYHPGGMPLIPGKVALVESGDPLAGEEDINVGKIKVYAWRGPDYIEDPAIDEAGVGWILAENWWPYQRPSFVTPPFAGYVSGHSVYSRAAAELVTLLTGDPYFPGGMGEFFAPKNEFLVFEEGPSQDITLQWATYRDASDQTSLSRIWGGIHPPVDDMPGRHIGTKIGVNAFHFAQNYFPLVTGIEQYEIAQNHLSVFPNPASLHDELTAEIRLPAGHVTVQLYAMQGQLCYETHVRKGIDKVYTQIPIQGLPQGIYLLRVSGAREQAVVKVIIE